MEQISYQLYSSRNFPTWDNTFVMLAELGYSQVEGFAALYDDASQIRKSLDKHNLVMPTAHFSLDLLEQRSAQATEIATTLGIERVFCPFLAQAVRPTDAQGYADFGRRLFKVAEQYDAKGIKVGWHNHDFEFIPLADGSVPMQSIFDAAPELEWEADIAWIARAGADPFDWIEREGSRIRSVHVKDIAPTGECQDEDGWADVGHGELDWKALVTALQQTPCEYWVMEHDNPASAERFATRSIAFCKTL